MGCGFGAGFDGVVACASSKLSSNAITIDELYGQEWASTATYNREGRQGYL